MSDFLVIGYGNTLRHDDGAGPWVAERVKALLGVQARCIAVPQLLPELAEVMGQAKCVVFVDARQGAPTVQIRTVEPKRGSHSSGTHASDPAALLDLAAALYDSQPTTWLVTVLAVDFRHGEGLSAFTRKVPREQCNGLLRNTSVCTPGDLRVLFVLRQPGVQMGEKCQHLASKLLFGTRRPCHTACARTPT